MMDVASAVSALKGKPSALKIEMLAADLLDLDGLVKQYPGTIAVNNVSFSIKAGVVFGAVLGALTLTVIQNVINLFGVQPAWETFCVGCIILLVTILSRLSDMAAERESRGIAS